MASVEQVQILIELLKESQKAHVAQMEEIPKMTKAQQEKVDQEAELNASAKMTQRAS